MQDFFLSIWNKNSTGEKAVTKVCPLPDLATVASIFIGVQTCSVWKVTWDVHCHCCELVLYKYWLVALLASEPSCFFINLFQKGTGGNIYNNCVSSLAIIALQCSKYDIISYTCKNFHFNLFRLISPQSFWLVIVGTAQMEFITMMTASCLGGLVPGLWYCACSQTDMAYWYTLYHGAMADVDITPVFFFLHGKSKCLLWEGSSLPRNHW